MSTPRRELLHGISMGGELLEYGLENAVHGIKSLPGGEKALNMLNLAASYTIEPAVNLAKETIEYGSRKVVGDEIIDNIRENYEELPRGTQYLGDFVLDGAILKGYGGIFTQSAKAASKLAKGELVETKFAKIELQPLFETTASDYSKLDREIKEFSKLEKDVEGRIKLGDMAESKMAEVVKIKVKKLSELGRAESIWEGLDLLPSLKEEDSYRLSRANESHDSSRFLLPIAYTICFTGRNG